MGARLRKLKRQITVYGGKSKLTGKMMQYRQQYSLPDEKLNHSCPKVVRLSALLQMKNLIHPSKTRIIQIPHFEME